MSQEEDQSTEDIWNTLYANDEIQLIVHKDDYKTMYDALTREKHRSLKGTNDRSRMKFLKTERIGDPDFYDVEIKLSSPNGTTIRTKTS